MSEVSAMSGSKWLAVPLAIAFLLLGWLKPECVLLDMPFGIAFTATDLAGRWQQGIMWAPSHRAPAILCFLVWPIVVSAVFAYMVTWLATRIWVGHSKWAHLYAVGFVVSVFSMILSVTVQPGSYFVSYWGYAVANY